jgi:hypothetical protein
MYRILYPEHRLVSEETIKAWYADAVVNGEISLPCNGESLDMLGFMMEQLEDAGLVTFATMEQV